MLKKHKAITFVFIVLISALIGFFALTDSGRSIASFMWGLMFRKNIQLKQEADKGINVLLLGIAGGKHDGPNLSDTIILAHIDQSSNQIDLISLPRDLWIPELSAKINHAYAYGEEQKKGIFLVKKVVERITGQEIHYVLVVNFSAFTQLIDLLGGVDVNVIRSLDDYEYPVEGKETDLCGHSEEELPLFATASSQLEAFPCRFEHVHFDRGIQHMDGEDSLIYTRSRHAAGSEGTDFARSNRQHQVVVAIKNKLLSLNTLANPVRLLGIYNILKDNINTDIHTSELDDFIRLAQKMKDAQIRNFIIDTGDEKQDRFGLLVNPIYNTDYRGQWVLIPRAGNGDFSEIQEYINCLLSNKNCVIQEKGIKIIDEITKSNN